jgi:hypothetical protein
MPTGYTANIKDGITFRQYALQCARAFGACIMQRDDDSGDPPKVPELSTYHADELKKAEARLLELQGITPEQAAVLCETDNATALRNHDFSEAERTVLRESYEAMLSNVRAWIPPSSEHKGYREFMESQIVESISFDCQASPAPTPLTPEAWLKDRIERAEWSVDYPTKESAKEIERHEERKRWIEQLYASLPTE